MKTKTPPIPQWMTAAATAAEARMQKAGIALTVGGEPTFVPIHPVGNEWLFEATGPTKLAYARKVVDRLLASPMAGGVAVFSPGKLYPGETNPRWAIRVIARRDGERLFRPAPPAAKVSGPQAFADAICKALGIRPRWVRLSDPRDPDNHVLALPLDHEHGKWKSAAWPLTKAQRVLGGAEGPAGLRLPLQHFPGGLSKRVITIEWPGRGASVFLPPLLQKPFVELLAAIEKASAHAGDTPPSLEGYLPWDEAAEWTVLGLTADPGVLEVNLPACAGWEEYARWIGNVSAACEAVGLRSWKDLTHPEGSGGGNHILWGGATIETNPFFTRPRWLASILRLWQRHPVLSYLFSGCYVGSSSQAPRPDESSRDLYDLEMAYRFLEALPPGDHRQLINETLRHLHTDVTGNTHRSEISFDKFWNPGWPGGALGLIEFRAVEALPESRWMVAVALLWHCLAAHALDAGKPRPLRDLSRSLHDRFFLPSVLWADLAALLAALHSAGYALEENVFREIWEWRFPSLLRWSSGSASLEIRKALESWPLLCETPLEGGNTSRFVDTSLNRIEFSASGDFDSRFQIYVAGRLLPLRTGKQGSLAGLRFRRTKLLPSLHPGVAPQVPLVFTILDRRTHRVVTEFALDADAARFRKVSASATRKLADKPCRPLRPGDLTFDLRKE